MFKKIAIGLGLVVVVIAVGVYYLSQNAGTIVKGIIEDQGTRVTQVDVKLNEVELNFTDLRAALRGLTVDNPPGFDTARAISLGEISVKMAKDWDAKLIRIEEIMINAPEITYEIGSGGSNIAKIQENVDTFMKVMQGGSGGSGSGASGSTASGSGESQTKLIIDNLYINDGRVNVSASMMKGQTLKTNLPNIHLTDIGKDSGGATPAEVADKVIAAITKYSGNAASSLDLSKLGLDGISGKAADMSKAAGDAAKKAMEDATGQAGGTGDAAKKTMDDAANKLKGLLGQ